MRKTGVAVLISAAFNVALTASGFLQTPLVSVAAWAITFLLVVLWIYLHVTETEEIPRPELLLDCSGSIAGKFSGHDDIDLDLRNSGPRDAHQVSISPLVTPVHRLDFDPVPIIKANDSVTLSFTITNLEDNSVVLSEGLAYVVNQAFIDDIWKGNKSARLAWPVTVKYRGFDSRRRFETENAVVLTHPTLKVSAEHLSDRTMATGPLSGAAIVDFAKRRPVAASAAAALILVLAATGAWFGAKAVRRIGAERTTPQLTDNVNRCTQRKMWRLGGSRSELLTFSDVPNQVQPLVRGNMATIDWGEWTNCQGLIEAFVRVEANPKFPNETAQLVVRNELSDAIVATSEPIFAGRDFQQITIPIPADNDSAAYTVLVRGTNLKVAAEVEIVMIPKQ